MSRSMSEARELIRLSVPVIVTQLSLMMMGVVDVIMVGHVGVDALGAVSLGRVWVFGTALFGMGIVMGVDPIISQAHGARQPPRISFAFQQGLFLSVLVSIPVGVSWLFTEPLLRALGQKPELCAMAGDFAMVQIPSIPCFLAYTVLRQFLQGRAIMRPAMWVALVANVVNLVLNWTFIYGHFGFPAMGVTGSGLATALTRAFMLAALVFMILRFKLHEGGWTGWDRAAFRLRGLGEILHYGMPVGIQIGLEVWAFEIATLFAGRIGTVDLGAHVVALTLASLTFMVPMGISMGTVTRVGNLIGEGKRELAQFASWVALALGALTMAGAAVIFVVFRNVLPRLYTDDPGVIAAAAGILPIAAAFQIFDGTQVVGIGVLRAMGRTRPAAAFNLIGYYALAIPIAWWLAFPQKLGLPGIWWGLCLGLAAVAAMLVIWVWRRGPARVASSVLVEVPREQPANP